MKYELITINWNPAQTKVWLFHVKRNCPDAKVTLLPDKKTIPWNWSSGKLECFNQPEYKSNRVICMDTDTIVTQDLGFIFDYLEKAEADIGASSKIVLRPFGKNMFTHYSSGFLPFFVDRLKPQELYVEWKNAFTNPAINNWRNVKTFEEVCMSFAFAMRSVGVWDIPLEIHGNICGRVYFGQVKIPVVIHYHKPERLRKANLEGFLDVKAK